MPALTTGPCDHCSDNSSKLIVLKYFSLPFTLFEPYGAVFIMNSKIHLRKNSSNEYFKTISHYFRVYSLSGFLKIRRSINGVVFFFAAIAEVQVTVLSVLNLPRQGLPLVQLGTVVLAARCFLPQKYFAIRQRTRNRGWIKSRWTCFLEAQNARWRVFGVFIICLWLVSRPLRIPNR